MESGAVHGRCAVADQEVPGNGNVLPEEALHDVYARLRECCRAKVGFLFGEGTIAWKANGSIRGTVVFVS